LHNAAVVPVLTSPSLSSSSSFLFSPWQALAAYSKCAELAPADTSGEVARKIKWLEKQCTRGKPPSRGAAFAGFSEGRGGRGSGGPAPAAMPGADLLRELGVEGPVRVPENVDAGLEPAAWARRVVLICFLHAITDVSPCVSFFSLCRGSV
jgi:hypothetical protein